MANEPKFTSSRFVLRPEEAFTVVIEEADPYVAVREWRVVFPSDDYKISTAYVEDRFSIYEVCFEEMGFLLTFTEL